MKSRPKKGFTLIELIAVLLLLSILAAVALNRNTQPSKLSPEVEVVKNHLRYAQSMAMLHGGEWGVKFESGTYFLFQTDETQKMIFPGENSEDVDLDGKSTAASAVIFDGWGMPHSGGAAMGSDMTLAFSRSGATSQIIITRDTGYIP
ncbi:MAG: pilus assembly FimT family protein [Desulfovibrionales bacterium]